MCACDRRLSLELPLGRPPGASRAQGTIPAASSVGFTVVSGVHQPYGQGRGGVAGGQTPALIRRRPAAGSREVCLSQACGGSEVPFLTLSLPGFPHKYSNSLVITVDAFCLKGGSFSAAAGRFGLRSWILTQLLAVVMVPLLLLGMSLEPRHGHESGPSRGWDLVSNEQWLLLLVPLVCCHLSQFRRLGH